uniref:C2 domain-containing protein n=1 Tax=Parascaris univalens TaxID=6257 RepID=A0A915AAM6_PARUN
MYIQIEQLSSCPPSSPPCCNPSSFVRLYSYNYANIGAVLCRLTQYSSAASRFNRLLRFARLFDVDARELLLFSLTSNNCIRWEFIFRSNHLRNQSISSEQL